jgi:hypothetical protein
MGRIEDALTVTEISRRCGAERHRIVYVLRSRGIEPVARVGAVKVFTGEQCRRIADELQRAGGRRPPLPHGVNGP